MHLHNALDSNVGRGSRCPTTHLNRYCFSLSVGSHFLQTDLLELLICVFFPSVGTNSHS